VAVDLSKQAIAHADLTERNRRKKSQDDVSALAKRKAMSHMSPMSLLRMTGRRRIRSSGINRHWAHQA